MFDRYYRIFLVPLRTQSKTTPTEFWPKAAVTASLAAAFASIFGVLVSLKSFQVNQEGLTIVVRRNMFAALPVVQPPASIEELERTDAAYQAEWKISIINTSNSVTIPITAYDIFISQFAGDGYSFTSEDLAPHSTDKLLDENRQPVMLPIEVLPGAVLRLTLLAATNVSAKAYPNRPPQPIPAPAHGLFLVPRGDQGDMFGNGGEDFGDRLDLSSREEVKQPCIHAGFQTGRGNQFFGTGFWYAQVLRIIATVSDGSQNAVSVKPANWHRPDFAEMQRP